jgi:hypothetical protein
MPLISRLRLHQTMSIASPVQWISFNHRYPSTVLHHRLHSPSPQLIVDAGPAHATYTVPMPAPREPVISAPKEPAMSASGEPAPREPRQFSIKGIPATPCQRRLQNASQLQIRHGRRVNIADSVAHPLLPNDSPRAFTTVRVPSALHISLTQVPGLSLVRHQRHDVSRRRPNLRFGLHLKRHR